MLILAIKWENKCICVLPSLNSIVYYTTQGQDECSSRSSRSTATAHRNKEKKFPRQVQSSTVTWCHCVTVLILFVKTKLLLTLVWLGKLRIPAEVACLSAVVRNKMCVRRVKKKEEEAPPTNPGPILSKADVAKWVHQTWILMRKRKTH